MRRPMWPIGFPLLIAFALAVVSAWFVLPAVVLLAVFLTRVLRFDPKRPPNAAIIAWPGGLSIRVRRSRRMVTIPWEECDDVIVREAPDDDATDFVAAILWPVIFVLDILSPRPDLSHSREIAIKRRPTGAGPAFAEVVVVGDRPFMLAQLIRDTATARTSSAAIVHAQ